MLWSPQIYISVFGALCVNVRVASANCRIHLLTVTRLKGLAMIDKSNELLTTWGAILHVIIV